MKQGCRQEMLTGGHWKVLPVKACLHLIFVGLLHATFVVSEFRDENRQGKLAAISMRFVAAMSQRFRTGFMQLGGDLGEN